jgi:xylose isomerase
MLMAYFKLRRRNLAPVLNANGWAVNAEAIIKDGRIDKFVEDRYASFKTGIGAKVRDHSATLEDLAAHALETKVCPDPGSGDEEELQEILNQLMFGKK